VQLADAVVAALNAGKFSLAFTAQRLYRPFFDLPDMSTLHVTVVPDSVVLTQHTRTTMANETKVDVAVQKKYKTEDAAELDPLVALVEEIAEMFAQNRVLAELGAVLLKVEHAPVYSPEHMQDKRMLTSIITLTYRMAD
jgi:hypothetical protein